MANQTETLIEAILSEIDEGILLPGMPLDEQTLASRHSMSRTPVREALIQLEAKGLISRYNRKGAILFKPSLEDFVSISEVHAKLEGQAAGLAARRMSNSANELLENTVISCEDHLNKYGNERPDLYYQCNLRFHEAVAIISNNEFLLETIKTTARKLMAYYRRRYSFPNAIEISAREHREIAELIYAGDRKNAELKMEQHVALDHVTMQDLLSIFE